MWLFYGRPSNWNTILLFALLPLCASAQTFPTKVPDELAKQCGFSVSDKNLVENCLKSFAKSECYAYPADEESRAKLTSCNINDLKASLGASSSGFLKMCGSEVVGSYTDLFAVAGHLTEAIMNNPNYFPLRDEQRVADELCAEKLGYTREQIQELDLNRTSPGSSAYIQFNACARAESARIHGVMAKGPLGKGQFVKNLSELNNGLHCYKKSYWPTLACPILSDVALFGAAGVAVKFVARESLPILARGIKPFARTHPAFATRLEDTLARLESKAVLPGEKSSVLHQHDLVNLQDSPYMTGVMKKADLNREQMTMGILDSDVGKLKSEWDRLVLNKTAESDKLLNVLAGRGSSPSARGMREIFGDAGFGEKSFLPPLRNDELRAVFASSKELRNYLHEAPGMSAAIQDVDAGRITLAQFKTRIKANLFHNGPSAAFWKFFGDVLVPGSLGKGDRVGKEFFRGSIFEGDTKNGVVHPVYPSPISAEGVVHTFEDRLSQGTRGGMLKIFNELGGEKFVGNQNLPIKDFPMGANTSYEMLIHNPEQTLEQMDKLRESSRSMTQLSGIQKQTFDEMILKGEGRLRIQNDYLKSHFEKTEKGYKITFEDPGGEKTVKVVNGDAPASEARGDIERLMLQEERANGNPMVDFVNAPSHKGLFYTSAALGAGIVLTDGICRPSAGMPAPSSSGAAH